MTDIILLALSVLKGTETESFFTVEGENYDRTSYLGALEPIIIHKFRLMKEYHEENELTIIALCTSKVMTEKKTLANGRGLTTTEFFKERVEELALENDLSYDKINIKNIEIDESKPIQGITETVNLIREIENKRKIWIDTHGAFRDIVLNMEAVVSLLKGDGIIPEKIYGVRYENNTAILVSQMASFSMFDFVSGMNEFINYGSARILNEYYMQNPDPGLASVIDAMNIISDGIQECNPRLYVEGLDKLSEPIYKLRNTNNIMGIFSSYIIESYGILLNKRKRTTIDIVERCLNYNMIQQALTILETLMPEEFYEHKIIYFDENELELIKKQYRELIPKPQDNKSYVINQYVTSNKVNNYLDNYVNMSGLSKDEVKNLEIFYLEAIIQEQSFIRFKSFDEYTLSDSFIKNKEFDFELIDDKKGTKIKLKTDVVGQDISKTGKVLRMHRALKVCRNKFNHCDPDRLETKYLKEALRIYIELIKELFQVYDQANKQELPDEPKAITENPESGKRKKEKLHINRDVKFDGTSLKDIIDKAWIQ